jgi:hypothetical protein
MTMTTETNDEEQGEQTTTRRTVLRAAMTAGGVGVIGAGASDEAAASPTPTEPDSPTPPVDQQYVAEIGEAARVLDYSIGTARDGDGDQQIATISVDVEADRPRLVAMSDVFGGVASSGVSRIRQQRATIPTGDSTIEMDVSVYDDMAAVGVATANGAVTVSTGIKGSGNPVVSLPLGVGVGAATMGIGTGVAAYRRYHDQDDAPVSVYNDEGGLL